MNKNLLDKQNKDHQEQDVTKGITFVTCPKHGIQYPKGNSCWKCATESK
jgi:hypothetical protein